MKELPATLKEFVAKQELLRLAYTDAKGYPRVVPVWYAAIDGDYFIGTETASAKLKAVRRDSRVGWVVDSSERAHYKGASFAGSAEEVTDSQMRTKIHHALGMKYFGSTDHPKFIEIYGQPNDAETAYLRLKPEDGFSWEY